MSNNKRNSFFCHYYHTNQGCWAGLNCKYIHGVKMYYCPNGINCPVKVYHEMLPSDNKESSRERDHDKNVSVNENRYKKQRKRSFFITEEKEIKDAVIHPSDQKMFQDLPEEIKKILKEKYSKCQEATNFFLKYYQLYSDQQQFLPIYKRMFPSTELDLCFIVDCTGSMNIWINSVRQEISGITAAIKYAFKTDQIRISFVGYRDIKDSERFIIQNFTSDLNQFKNFVSKIQATGGDDEPEDLAGGFVYANQLFWKNQAKLAVLITDAPAHGKQYHGQDQFYDNYIDGDPQGISLKQQFKILLQKGVQIFVVEITQATKVMFEKFQQYQQDYSNQPLQILKLGNSTKGFSQLVTQAVQKTMTQTFTQLSKEDPDDIFYKVLKILQDQNTAQSIQVLDNLKFQQNKEILDKNEIKSQDLDGNNYKEQQYIEIKLKIEKSDSFRDLNHQVPYDSVCHTYFIVEDKGSPINWKKPLVQNSSIKTTLKIDSVPFAEGAMRYAFFAQDDFLNQKLVAKVSKKYFTDQEKNKEIIVKDLEVQFICQHLVNLFNDLVVEHVVDTKNLKNFVHSFIYAIDHKDIPYKYFSVENYIPGEYTKFNNNAGWTNFQFDESGLLSQTLSHFSYQKTEGYLMIVDLQGAQNMLTDPQIHCLDQHRFGSGNLGYTGMFKFFLNHQCNQYCEGLNLINPSKDNIPEDLTFFSKNVNAPVNYNQSVYSMCDLCKIPFKTTAEYVYNQRKNCQEKYCDECNKKKQQTMIAGVCEVCDKNFQSSLYWFMMKRTEFPKLCSNCRRNRRDKLRENLTDQKEMI